MSTRSALLHRHPVFVTSGGPVYTRRPLRQRVVGVFSVGRLFHRQTGLSADGSACVLTVFPVSCALIFEEAVWSACAVGAATTRVMSVNDQRPVNLALGTIHFPLPAIVSLLHRISGFALFGVLPLLLWAWQQSLASPEAFHALIDALPFRLAAILVLAGVIYHLVAGIRHLLMDAGIGETLAGGRRFAWATLVISAALVAVTGVWIW